MYILVSFYFKEYANNLLVIYSEMGSVIAQINHQSSLDNSQNLSLLFIIL